MAVSMGVTFVGALIALFVKSVLIGLLVVLALPLFLIGPTRYGARAARAGFESQQDKAMVASLVQENVGAHQLVKAFGLQDRELGRFRAQLDRLGQSTVRSSWLASLPGTFANLTVYFIQVVVIGVGTLLVLGGTGKFTAGTLMQVFGLSAIATSPVLALSGILPVIL